MVIAPPARRRLVGKALRRHRERLGYTLDDAARILDCDRSKVSRIETGQRGVRREDLRKLMAEYGITGDQQVMLAELADPRGAFGWHRDYADVLPGAAGDYLMLETAASVIAGYEAQRVPALLQTPAYARALAQASPALGARPHGTGRRKRCWPGRRRSSASAGPKRTRVRAARRCTW